MIPVVVGVVPGQGDGIVGRRGGQACRSVGDGRRRGVDVVPAGPLALPVPVDGLDAVGVVSVGLYRIVGVGGGRRTRVRHQNAELAPLIVHADAPQDHVAGDAVVTGVVPAEDHLAVGCRGFEAPGLGGRLRGFRRRHRIRGRAGQRLVIAFIVGEADLNLNGLAQFAIGKGVCVACSPADVHIVSQPLVSEGSVLQPRRRPRCPTCPLPASRPPARSR